MTKYHIDLDSKGVGAILIYEDDGTLHEVRSDNPDFTRVFSAVQQGKSWEDVDGVAGVRTVVALSDRIKLADDQLFFDGEAVDSSLTTAIKRYHLEGRDPIGLVNFMTKLFDASDSYRIRNFAFQWLTTQRLEVTPEGNLLGYRGVDSDLRSKHRGPGCGAFVNGVWDEGIDGIPNEPGNVITMPRHTVSDDPDVDCGPGLHVGSEDYARSWGVRHIIIEVEPQDIVSVPKSSVNKMRVCAYRVVEEIIPEAPVPDHEAPAAGANDLEEAIPEERGNKWRDRLKKVVGRLR